MRRCLNRIVLLGLMAAVLSFSHSAHALLTNGENAEDLLGQTDTDAVTPYYTKACTNDANSPIGFGPEEADMPMAFDTVHHRLFIGDCTDNRVLVFTLNSSNMLASKVPANVIGQPDFLSCAVPYPTTQASLNCPSGLAYDGTNDRLFVADQGNRRVLVYNASSIANGMNAAHVLGEPDFITVNVATNQSGFSLPGALAYDAVNTLLYVADINNNRVMVFNVAPGSIADDENASFVLGQAGFTTTIPATSQSGLSAPYGLAYDSANTRLFVGELGSLGSGITGNNRIVVYNTSSLTNGMNASNVLGQSNFTTANVCPDPTQSSFCNVFNFDYDGVHNRLFVADGGNSRVLAFNTSSITNGMNAANVLGPTTFTDGNGGSTWQSGLGDPSSAFYDSTNNQVYVGDAGNNRVMIYGTASITNGENASDEIGQYASLTSTATVNWSQPAPNNGLIAQGFNNPAGIALDRVNHRLFVVDNLNSRAFVYNLNTDNSFSTRVPANVLGEPDFFSTNYGNTDVDTLNDPNGAAFDAANNRLFVADTASNRVLVYNTSSITNGMNAANVLGQANFTNAGTAKTQARMNAPEGIAYDSTNNRLFVADQGNNRVLVYNTSSITNGMNAANVLGQADFTHNATAHTQAGMNNPSDVRYDPVNNRLFVADLGNNRVLVFNASSITNGMNAANVLGQTSFTANGSGTTQSTMNVPASVDYDPNTGRAFVVDNTNHRVLIFNAGPGNISNGMKASYVLGQADFTSAFYNYPPNQGSLTYPFFVTYDPGSGRLFVGDTNNNRVMIFEASTNSTPAQQGFIPGYE